MRRAAVNGRRFCTSPIAFNHFFFPSVIAVVAALRMQDEECALLDACVQNAARGSISVPRRLGMQKMRHIDQVYCAILFTKTPKTIIAITSANDSGYRTGARAFLRLAWIANATYKTEPTIRTIPKAAIIVDR